MASSVDDSSRDDCLAPVGSIRDGSHQADCSMASAVDDSSRDDCSAPVGSIRDGSHQADCSVASSVDDSSRDDCLAASLVDDSPQDDCSAAPLVVDLPRDDRSAPVASAQEGFLQDDCLAAVDDLSRDDCLAASLVDDLPRVGCSAASLVDDSSRGDCSAPVDSARDGCLRADSVLLTGIDWAGTRYWAGPDWPQDSRSRQACWAGSKAGYLGAGPALRRWMGFPAGPRLAWPVFRRAPV